MKRKIFIVDQSELITSQLTTILGSTFEVKTASHADKALLEIIEWLPDLLVTGVEIGNITGFDLCHILKMMQELASMPIILLTSYLDEKTSIMAHKVGVDCYIQKSTTLIQEIVPKINDLLYEPEVHTLPGKKITTVLLVDDSALIRRMVGNMLNSLGTDVVSAKDGEEALEMLEYNKVDLVLSDYHMPRMNGPELIGKLRLTYNKDDLPIFLISGVENVEKQQEVIDNGANGILLKPVSGKNLKDLLNAFASGSAF